MVIFISTCKPENKLKKQWNFIILSSLPFGFWTCYNVMFLCQLSGDGVCKQKEIKAMVSTVISKTMSISAQDCDTQTQCKNQSLSKLKTVVWIRQHIKKSTFGLMVQRIAWTIVDMWRKNLSFFKMFSLSRDKRLPWEFLGEILSWDNRLLWF